MQKSKVREKWADGELALGTLVKSTDPVHTEVLSQMDFDFLWYDLEHNDKSVETFANLCRAARIGDVDVLARPAKWETMRMGRMLEAGAHGIMYPRCESADEAREVVRWAKFAPLGERGFDGGSADNNFGLYPAGDYTQKANQESWLLIQIESPVALPHVREIAEVEGVDGIFFGPGDFSLLAGKPGQIKDKEVLHAAKQVADATLAAGKIFGTLVFDEDHSKYMQEAGARLLVHGADIIYYKTAYTKLLKEYGRS